MKGCLKIIKLSGEAMSELNQYQFWQDYGSFIVNFFISSGAAFAIIKFWLEARLKAAIDHEYSNKIEILKSTLSKEITHQAVVYSSFSEGQKAAMERKLCAIDKLWKTLIQFREDLPLALSRMDILLVEEYLALLSDEMEIFRILDKDITSIMKDIDDVRPYVGELMWFLFFSYRRIFSRIAWLIKQAMDGKRDKIYWYKDTALRNVFDSILTKEEMLDFDGLKFQKIQFLKQKLESKIITEMHKVISGKDLVNDSTDQIMLIQKRLREAGNVN